MPDPMLAPMPALPAPPPLLPPLQGEAIAFALGGNARMMRARNLGALVNHTEPPADPAAGAGLQALRRGAADAARAADPVAAAEVVLHFHILQHQGQQQQEEGQAEQQQGQSKAASGSGTAVAGGRKSKGSGSPAMGAAAAAGAAGGRAEKGAGSGAASDPAAAPATAPAHEQLVGRLLIRRRVTRGGRSDLAVQQLPAGAGGSTGGGSTGREGSTAAGAAQWRGTTPAALRELLAPFGIQTEAVDRWGGGIIPMMGAQGMPCGAVGRVKWDC